MATCTSRRACADRYSFRLYKETDGNAEVGKYIWTEYRCPNVSSNGKTCTECAVKLPKHKYQSSPKCDHGFVDGPYPSDSKLYGSPFYNEQIKKGWKAYALDETRAKEAQLSASSTMPKKTVKADEGVSEVTANVVTANVVTAATTKADKPKQPRKAKVVKNATEVALTPVNIQPCPLVTGPPRFVEAMTSPIRIQDVVIVKVKKIHCEGKDYYFDAISGKAYAVSTNGVGPYKGRYDPEAETINTSYPDSDLE
jgi:hypothetical protein